MGFILPLINIAGWLRNTALGLLFFITTLIDGAVYQLVAYSFKIFQLMCTVNFNSIYGIAEPLVDRLQSVIIVFVVYLIGVHFIQSMLNPDKAVEDGKKILINLFIATAMFISYNFVFSVFNEINIALIGNPSGYKYTTLSEVFDLNDESNNGKPDPGFIVRAIFATKDNEDIVDPGNTIALALAGAFYRDIEGNQDTSDYTYLIGSVCIDENNCDFERLSKNMPDNIVDGKVKFTPFVGFAVALFVIWSMFSASLKIGIRMFKLLILQMLFPIVAVDVIKNGVKGKFKEYCSEYLSVFLDAVIRMATILIVTSFVSQFVVHINDYFPTLQSEESVFTKIIIKVIIIIAAYMFAGQAPEYINKHILGGKVETSSKKNFLGGLLGGAIGGVAGFAGGLAGGGIGGAIAGLGTGALGGVKSGAKGNTVSDLFKVRKDAKTDAKALGASLAERGDGSGLRGLGNTIAGAAGTAVGMRSMYDRQLANLDRQSKALDELDAAEKFAVKDSKMKDGDTWVDNKTKTAYSSKGYSSGYNNVKLGEDKDAYAAQMLQYDESYQDALSHYDYLQSDNTSMAAAESEFNAASDAYSNFSGLYSEYEERQNAINDLSLGDAMGKKFIDTDGVEKTVTDQASYEQMKTAASATAQEHYKDAIAAHDRYEAANNNLKTASADRERDLNAAKKAVQDAKYNAEQKAKAYYDHRKKVEGDKSEDVKSKRKAYLAAKGIHTDDPNNHPAILGENRTDEKRNNYEARAAIKNKPGYANTHGQKPKS